MLWYSLEKVFTAMSGVVAYLRELPLQFELSLSFLCIMVALMKLWVAKELLRPSNWSTWG